MGTAPPNRITHLLDAIRAGQTDATHQLLTLVYGELKAIARRQMAHVPPGDTLQPTALVHEAYMRLFGKNERSWKDRRHFLNAAARAMRDIIVEQARRHASRKRGGDRQRVPIDTTMLARSQDPAELLALDEAIRDLEQDDNLSAEVLMLRHFAGLTVPETAAALDIAPATVDRHARYARAWLHRRMFGDAILSAPAREA